MRFQELHEKVFMPYWISSVHKNDEQALAMHFVFLSQILGTVPISTPKAHWKAVRSHDAMRVVFNGKLLHPKLHFFIIGGSGSGKGAGQKSLEFLFTVFNIHEFAKRYGVAEPIEENIWQALEKHTGELRKAKWERKRIRKKIGEGQEIEDLSQEANPLDDMLTISERKNELEEAMSEPPNEEEKDTPFVAKTRMPVVMPYKMTESEKREIKEAFRKKSGEQWDQFTTKNYQVWPTTIKKNTSTTADLIGGFEPDKAADDGKNSKMVWTPGYFQTHALLGYDEARSILANSDSDAYGLFCGALDDEGAVETKARKDRDEYGNAISYQTCSSMIAGTTEFGDLSSFVAMGGFLQRFIIQYRHVTISDMIDTADKLAHNKSLPSDRWNLAREYYKNLMSMNIAYKDINATDSARDYATAIIKEDYAYFGKTLGYGTHAYNMAATFLNRRIGFYFKAAAIMAAIEGKTSSEVEHFKYVHENLGKPWSQSIANYLENCFSASEMAESERKSLLLNGILRARMDALRVRVGGDYIPVERLAKDISMGVVVQSSYRYANDWISENRTYDAIRMKILEWADNHPDTVSLKREVRFANSKPYDYAEVKLINLPQELIDRDTAIKRDDRDKLVADQGGVVSNWNEILPSSVQVNTDDDDNAGISDTALKEIRKKKKQGVI